MLNLNFLRIGIIAATMGLTFSACDSDDVDSSSTSNTIFLNDTEVQITNSLTVDRGLGGPVRGIANFAPNHYVQIFNISDGEIVYQTGEFTQTVDASFFLEILLFSSDSSKIEDGIYEFIDGTVRSETGNFVSSRSYFLQDSNDNGQIDDDQIDLLGDLSAGTVTVEALEGDNKYRLDFDLEFDTEDRITGSYEGTFDLVLER